ncbi:MAG: isoleucine--tRNA ligase [Mycoplasmataceae bacterium]|nr:isoleucine--tRNA ligase [Mycoplasmataceae bacterium]
MDFKNTLNILTTDFEMKANLNTKEPLIQKRWRDEKTYQKVLAKNEDGKIWTLHDGPPYANGNIHVGHALNKIIKDVIVRYRNMQGYYCEYIPGWDTHGLPIEHALMSSGANKDPKLSIVEKRNNCRDFASKFINLQIAQFTRLGLLTDFQKIYRTYDSDYETRQLELLLTAINHKLIYRDLKPVYWSWSSQSALADAEVEYRDIKSPSVYIAFSVVDGKGLLDQNDKLVIWTTTPWTIPSNLAIAVNPKFTYVKVSANGDNFVVSKERLVAIAKVLGWAKYEIIKEIKGDKLENVTYKHPLYDRVSPIILASYVSNEDGTGLVHNAPGFGEDDYLACKKYGIAPFSPIDNYGKFTKEVNDPTIVGIFYNDADKIISETLLIKKALLRQEYIIHSVAHDWRTKKPVIYRATKQWFIDIKKVQDDILIALEQVKFKNEQNRKHLVDMMKNRTEWCISRQRVWGVPIPIIFDEKDEPIFDFELISNIIRILQTETSNVWFEKPVDYFLTKHYKENPNHKKYRKETDIMDVWFDSGTSFTLLEPNRLNCPANLYFEGNDQYRGWFNSSAINSVIANKKAPYQMLLSHGMVLDEQGRKMSKSVGNVIDPLVVCEKYGADVLRLWAANTDYQIDVKVSDNILLQTTEIYRRLRNTLFRFCLANTSDFDISKNGNYSFDEVDTFVLNQLSDNINRINLHYENYDFNNVVKIINGHIIELSSWYFDLIKDALYCEAKDDPKRRKIQTVLFYILKSYLILLTPIIPHTCEETYKFINFPHKLASINLEKWLDKLDIRITKSDTSKWEYFFKIKSVVYTELEMLRNTKKINKNNQAIVELEFDNKYQFTEKLMAKYLNVAKVTFLDEKATKISAKCDDAKLVKCLRCWNYFEQSEMQDEHLCRRCDSIIKVK